jgi:TetR/AcrR family transcriptional repressor of mexJK operon
MTRRSTPPLSKEAQILKAAGEVFLEQGYGAASMDSIAARAAISKATIYAHFNSKAELFGALIRARCAAELDDRQPELVDAADPPAALRALGLQFWEMLTAPDVMAMHRVILAEAPRQPEMGQAFYNAGPCMGLTILGAAFEQWDRAGLLSVPDPREAADMFLSLIRCDAYLRRLFDVPPDPTDPSPDRIVARAVDSICRTFAAR